MEDLTKNSAEFLRDEFAKFQSIYEGEIELSLAAEYMLDCGFNKHLKSGELLCLFDNYVLVEMSYAIATVNYISIISEIMGQGYFVVLAHPERYLYLKQDEYLKLKNIGVLFQLNLMSITGMYGKRVQERAFLMLKNEMYDMIGSDLHNLDVFKDNINNAKLYKSQLEQLVKIKK